ncbi:glycoside hydrolase family 172 protein [Mucilaginibacter sp. dw_454]|uniref:glycoside hydrolase family 172 protein n=1 Tax=Mucilaginibacter sp. dw_454 TaxID=2720079 RepID=UPI001BD26B5E|nr:glycoside hydrolase family 172 protein [Mucilaginibacter sp. dw_454]
MVKKIAAIILLALIAHASIAQQKVISIGTLLNDMVNRSLDVLCPSPYYTSKLQTSHDRRSLIPGTPSWHANDDGSGFIRYEANKGRVEKVLFDEKGPGVITRIITTGGAKGTNLRFYFDGEKEASVVIPAYDIAKLPIHLPDGLLLLHEHYNTTQGSSLYYPIPYGRSCKITVDDLNRAYYFHANYRTYAKSIKVKTFTVKEAKTYQKQADETGEELLYSGAYVMNEADTQRQLVPGASLILSLPADHKAIRTLAFNLDGYAEADYGQMMRGLIVKITFDGRQTVSVPLSDFVGSGMGAPAVKNYYLFSDGKGNMSSKFIMPYKKSAKIELVNISNYPVEAQIRACTSPWKWTPNTLYFHAAWRQETGLKTNAGLDYNMATIVGRGVFKGDVLSLYNHTPRWYGEGDEHIWVDDESFPSHFGCGTEDYYNTTFAPIHVFQTPFGGAMREDDEASRGYNTFLRTRNLDAVPFKKKLKFEFELLSWDTGLVDYSSTVFWYGDLNSRAITASDDQEALKPLPKPVYTGDEN